MHLVQEHAGNDPNTQLVPASSGSGTWTRPDDLAAASHEAAAPTAAAGPNITSGSTWGAQQRPASAPWQPQPSAPAGPYARERVLNPDEYPSLAEGARAEPGAHTITKPSQPAHAQHRESQVSLVQSTARSAPHARSEVASVKRSLACMHAGAGLPHMGR